MRLPYKYPYVSIFILGYYFLEHEGYYYKLRNYFGYSQKQNINYVITLADDSLQNLKNTPGRKTFVYYWRQKDDEKINFYQELARHFKEKYRSPIMFTERFCNEDEKICIENKTPFYAIMKEGEVLSVLQGDIEKKGMKKRLHEFNKL